MLSMSQSNRFVIHNNSAGLLFIAVEPEGAVVPLSKGEEVHVSEQFDEHPVTLNVSMSEEGRPVVAVWPGDGHLRVEKNGIDVLES